MATRNRLSSHGIKNLTKPKPKDVATKSRPLVNKIISRRPALRDRTNRAQLAVNASKQLLNKPDLNFIKTKPKTIITQKPIETILKPVSKEEKETRDQIHPVFNVKRETKLSSYSVHHFGLIEEKDTDPLLVPNYVNNILTHLRNLEIEYHVSKMFLVGHKTTPRMRSVLVDWLVEIHSSFKLVQETLYLCVSIVDRYLQKNKSIGRINLQLVGIAALYIASKFEDLYSPEIADCVFVCDDLFSKKKILEMEYTILKAVDFKLGSPCALHFLRRYSKVAKVQAYEHTLAKYLIELCLIEHEYSHIAPSLIAASAISLSLKLLNESNLDEKTTSLLEYVTGYKQKVMIPVIKSLAKSVLNVETSKYKAIKNKYAVKKHCSVSSRTELKCGLIKQLAE